MAQYGPSIISRVNFDRGRIRPNLSVNASLHVVLYEKDLLHVDMQVDGDNLNNQLNVIDFGGLFSGNAIAPHRNGMLRLLLNF